MTQHESYRTVRDGWRARGYTHSIFAFNTCHVCRLWTETRHLIHAHKFTWVNVFYVNVCNMWHKDRAQTQPSGQATYKLLAAT